MKKIEFPLGCTIPEAMDILLRYKEEGETVCGEFNGVMLFSESVTVESAYKEIVGMSKEEFDRLEWWKDK